MTKTHLPNIKIFAEAIDKMLDTPCPGENLTIGEALYSYHFKKDRIAAADVLKELLVQLTAKEEIRRSTSRRKK